MFHGRILLNCYLGGCKPENVATVRSKELSGGSRISGMGVDMFKGEGVRLADFSAFFLNIPWKWNNLVSLRPNYVIFIGYLKTGGGEVNPLIPVDLPLGQLAKLEPLFEKKGFDGFDMWSVRTACDIKGDGRRGATGKAWASFWEKRLLWFWHVKHSGDAVRTACDIKGDGRRGATGKAWASFWEKRLLWFWHVKHSGDAVRTACDIKGDGRCGATGKAWASFWERRLRWFWHVECSNSMWYKGWWKAPSYWQSLSLFLRKKASMILTCETF